VWKSPIVLFVVPRSVYKLSKNPIPNPYPAYSHISLNHDNICIYKIITCFSVIMYASRSQSYLRLYVFMYDVYNCGVCKSYYIAPNSRTINEK
jgi:hypothetical protein